MNEDDGTFALALVPPGEAWRYFRIADGKANMAPPVSTSTWFRMESVHLGNGLNGEEGDSVGVVTLFKKPPIFKDVPMERIDSLMTAIRGRSGGWRLSPQAKDWFGHLVGKHLLIPVGEPDQKQKELSDTEKANRKRVAAMIDAWQTNGAILTVEEKDKKGATRKVIVLGNWFEAPR